MIELLSLRGTPDTISVSTNFWFQFVPYYWSCQPLQTFKLVYLMKIFFTRKWKTYTLIGLSTAINCCRKINLPVLVQKLTFLPQAKFLTSSLRKEQKIISNFFSNERTFNIQKAHLILFLYCNPKSEKLNDKLSWITNRNG